MRYLRQFDAGPVALLQESMFFAKAMEPDDPLQTLHPGWPLDQQIGFLQKGLKYSSGEFEIDLHITSTPELDVLYPATLLCPPTCMIFTAQADDGTPAFAYQPTVHVFGGKIFAHVGAVNAIYAVESLDKAISVVGLVPMDRWGPPGVINYQPRPDGAFVLLMCTDAETLKLIAFESPVIVGCPAGAPASGGISASSIAGL